MRLTRLDETRIPALGGGGGVVLDRRLGREVPCSGSCKPWLQNKAFPVLSTSHWGGGGGGG